MKRAALLTALALALSPWCASAAWAQLTPEENATFERALEIMGDDPAGARTLIEPLADKGDGEALNFLAILVRRGGPDWEPDPARGHALHEEALKAGSKAAALNIAIGLMIDSEADHARAIELLNLADTEEHLKVATAYPWGRAYLFGWGVARDMAKGVAYLEAYLEHRGETIDDWTADAHFLLGRAYRNGWDVEIDAEKAFRHFQIAADLDDPRAQWNAGMMLLQGEGVEADEAEAYRYVKMSAEAGHIDGMVSHAVMLATGQGVEEDDAAARDWYYGAAQQGSAHALRGLGMMLVTGEGGQPDPALGIAMLQLAAEAGEENAALLLGMIPDDAADPQDVADARAYWLDDHAPPEPVQ